MRALVDQFTAAGDLRDRTPLLLVADPAAVTVAGADEYQRAERAGVHDLARFQESRVKAMIESGFDDALVLRGSCRDRLHLGERASRRFLDQHMPSGFEGADR